MSCCQSSNSAESRRPKPDEERPAVERRRRPQRLEAARARLGRPVPVRRALGDAAAAARRRRARCPGPASETRSRSVLEPAAAERGAQRRERAPERRARPLGVALGPEQRRDRVAADGMRLRSRGTRAARSPCACPLRAAARPPRSPAGRAARSRAAALRHGAIVTATESSIARSVTVGAVATSAGTRVARPAVTIPERCRSRLPRSVRTETCAKSRNRSSRAGRWGCA